ncbi:MAG: Gfo/Idh/MocA family protein [Ktedonobacterales bacterium]
MASVRIAILGSGIFAREAHAPALHALEDRYEVVAIFSRRIENAAALAATFPHPIALYTDATALLARDDIEAVDILLPISLQPEMIEAALHAGKHIISEKPAAPDVASGRHLLELSEECRRDSGRIWMVAENFRYAEVYQVAQRSILDDEIGKPIQMSWSNYVAMDPENKYYHTAWRRDNSFPGGFLLDGGVHNIAAIRTVMGEIDYVSALVTQTRRDLPPADTLAATLRFASGAIGTFSMTFVQGIPWESPMYVVGETGALRLHSHALEIMSNDYMRSESFQEDTVTAELADFADAIQQGRSVLSTSLKAVQDVAVIAAILESAKSGHAAKPAMPA